MSRTWMGLCGAPGRAWAAAGRAATRTSAFASDQTRVLRILGSVPAMPTPVATRRHVAGRVRRTGRPAVSGRPVTIRTGPSVVEWTVRRTGHRACGGSTLG
jgi:hypothetical protein